MRKFCNIRIPRHNREHLTIIWSLFLRITKHIPGYCLACDFCSPDHAKLYSAYSLFTIWYSTVRLKHRFEKKALRQRSKRELVWEILAAELAELTNRIYWTSEDEALMNIVKWQPLYVRVFPNAFPVVSLACWPWLVTLWAFTSQVSMHKTESVINRRSNKNLTGLGWE